MESPTIATFAPHVNETYRAVVGPGAAVELELIEARALARSSPGQDRGPFSLIFRGPPGDHLPQAIYRLEHEALGALDIFLVPLGPEGDPKGHHYQAIFN